MSSPADTLFNQFGKSGAQDELTSAELHSVLASLGWHSTFPAVSAVLRRHPGDGINRSQLDSLLLDIQESLRNPPPPRKAAGFSWVVNHWLFHALACQLIFAVAFHSLPARWPSTPAPLAGALVMQIGSAVLAAVPTSAPYGVITGIVASLATLVVVGAFELDLGHFHPVALTDAAAQHEGTLGFIRMPAVQLLWHSVVMAYYVARFLWDPRVRYE